MDLGDCLRTGTEVQITGLHKHIHFQLLMCVCVCRKTFLHPHPSSCSSSSFLGRCSLNASFMDHQYSASMLLPTAQLQLPSTVKKKRKKDQYLAVFHFTFMEGFNLVFCLEVRSTVNSVDPPMLSSSADRQQLSAP